MTKSNRLELKMSKVFERPLKWNYLSFSNDGEYIAAGGKNLVCQGIGQLLIFPTA